MKRWLVGYGAALSTLLVMAARLVADGLPLRAACRAAIVDALTDDADTAAALAEVVDASLPA
jgi:nitric oxide reductase NorQ protein